MRVLALKLIRVFFKKKFVGFFGMGRTAETKTSVTYIDTTNENNRYYNLQVLY